MLLTNAARQNQAQSKAERLRGLRFRDSRGAQLNGLDGTTSSEATGMGICDEIVQWQLGWSCDEQQSLYILEAEAALLKGYQAEMSITHGPRSKKLCPGH